MLDLHIPPPRSVIFSGAFTDRMRPDSLPDLRKTVVPGRFALSVNILQGRNRGSSGL
jgi:hypothetical protein